MESLEQRVSRKLAEKYDLGTVFWYIEYPHKSFWTQDFNQENYKQALRKLHAKSEKPPVLLYLHIPFCEQMCYFCVCNFKITQNYDRVKNYMSYLHKEIRALKDFFKKESITPNFQELHFGGGSPTYLREQEFDELIEALGCLVSIDTLREFAIEIDPRRVDKERLEFYAKRGINRLSFGIQDFDSEVQRRINRVQPKELMDELLTPEIRALFKNGINFDIICGLPGQTLASFRDTIEKVIELSPNKISLTFMSYSPNAARHQKLMLKDGAIPDLYEQKMLFLESLKMLSANGYIRMGYDHFAKASDPVAQARQQRKMAWNSFGFTPGFCTNFIGLGVHSYSIIGPYYSQNTYDHKLYQKNVDEGNFPIFRGRELTSDDVLRRDIIHQLRGYFQLKFKEVEDAYGIVFTDYFAKELAILRQDLSRDGLVEIQDDGIVITDLGQQFANVVCSKFDAYLTER